jgi:hypothetical protein
MHQPHSVEPYLLKKLTSMLHLSRYKQVGATALLLAPLAAAGEDFVIFAQPSTPPKDALLAYPLV